MAGTVPLMPNDAPEPAELAHSLLGLTEQLILRSQEDPFSTPVLSVALAITRQLDAGELDEKAVGALVHQLRDAAFVDRAARIAGYVGGVEMAANEHVLASLARHLLRPDPNDSPVPWAKFRDLVDRTRYAAVFTAHPTFALPKAVNHALAEAASGRLAGHYPSHRPKRPDARGRIRRRPPSRFITPAMRWTNSWPRC